MLYIVICNSNYSSSDAFHWLSTVVSHTVLDLYLGGSWSPKKFSKLAKDSEFKLKLSSKSLSLYFSVTFSTPQPQHRDDRTRLRISLASLLNDNLGPGSTVCLQLDFHLMGIRSCLLQVFWRWRLVCLPLGSGSWLCWSDPHKEGWRWIKEDQRLLGFYPCGRSAGTASPAAGGQGLLVQVSCPVSRCFCKGTSAIYKPPLIPKNAFKPFG
jgi:hypothetical protein